MEETLERLRLNAAKCRDLASTAMTPTAREVLTDLAREYSERASTLNELRPPSSRPAFKWPLA
jgi:hypothetical protein